MKEFADIITCPFCKNQQDINLNLDLKVQKVICENYQCKKEFSVPLKFHKVYLSRTFAVSYCKYKFPFQIKSYYSGIIEIIDPLELYKKLDPKPVDSEIPDLNKQWINNCNIYVGCIYNPSFGTLSELYYAKSKQMPVYVINPNKVWINDIWLKYNTNKIFTEVSECFHYVINNIIYNYNLIKEEKTNE